MPFRYRTVGDLILRKAIPGNVLEDLPHDENEANRLSLGKVVSDGLRQICIDCWNVDPSFRPSAASVLQRVSALIHTHHDNSQFIDEGGRLGGLMLSSPRAHQGLNMVERVKMTITDSIPQYSCRI